MIVDEDTTVSNQIVELQRTHYSLALGVGLLPRLDDSPNISE